jgi:hypothetical protein
MQMNFDIPSIRLRNQLLSASKFTTAKEVVSHFGAIQAQDYPMAKWAVGVRLPGSAEIDIEKALDTGELVRTHVLRPTWHLAAAEDIHWMLMLTAKSIIRAMGSANRQLGLDDKIIGKSMEIIGTTLEGNNHQTRDALMKRLNEAGIETHSFRGLHIMLHAECVALVCNGIRSGKDHTYALMSERIANAKTLTKEEALAELAKRYFTSHGPATIRDFTWWSGLPAADSRTALELVKKEMTSVEHDGLAYWFFDHGIEIKIPKTLLLPAFDEYLIAYKDRSASIRQEHAPHAFTTNGIFKPLIVTDGQVGGTWKRTIKKDKVIIEPNFFGKATKADRNEFAREAEKYGAFIGKNVEVIF